MHKFLLRARHIKQRVTASGHFIQTCTDHDDQIRFFDTFRQLGVNTDADVTRIIFMSVVE